MNTQQGQASDGRHWAVTLRGALPKTHVWDLPERAHLDIDAYQQAWRKVTAAPDGDDELFLEDVARLAAVQRHIGADRTLIRYRGRTTHLSGEPFTGDLSTVTRWGMQSMMDTFDFGPIPADHAADRYHQLAVFYEHAGRRALLADATDESLAFAIERANPQGGKVVIKSTRPKFLFEILDVPQHGADAAIGASENLLLALMNLDGDKDAFLVQQHIPMTYERRYFIVDGTPVTSAGCIEEYTPYDNTGDPHDPRMHVTRGDQDIVIDHARTGELTTFATTVAADLRASAPELIEYVLDVAYGAFTGPLVIELNSIRNSGLYATDPNLVVAALAAR